MQVSLMNAHEERLLAQTLAAKTYSRMLLVGVDQLDAAARLSTTKRQQRWRQPLLTRPRARQGQFSRHKHRLAPHIVGVNSLPYWETAGDALIAGEAARQTFVSVAAGVAAESYPDIDRQALPDTHLLFSIWFAGAVPFLHLPLPSTVTALRATLAFVLKNHARSCALMHLPTS